MKIKIDVNVHDSFYCKDCGHVILKGYEAVPFCDLFVQYLPQDSIHRHVKCRKCIDACIVAAVRK